jgi:hypothetical protein
MLVVVLVIVVVSVVDAMGERRAAVGVSVMRAAVMVALLGLVAAASSSGADVLTDNLSSADQGTAPSSIFVSPACPGHRELPATLVVDPFCSRQVLV